jgi:hypothetical protein
MFAGGAGTGWTVRLGSQINLILCYEFLLLNKNTQDLCISLIKREIVLISFIIFNLWNFSIIYFK